MTAIVIALFLGATIGTIYALAIHFFFVGMQKLSIPYPGDSVANWLWVVPAIPVFVFIAPFVDDMLLRIINEFIDLKVAFANIEHWVFSLFHFIGFIGAIYGIQTYLAKRQEQQYMQVYAGLLAYYDATVLHPCCIIDLDLWMNEELGNFLDDILRTLDMMNKQLIMYRPQYEKFESIIRCSSTESLINKQARMALDRIEIFKNSN
jgi:hypothetical protein